MEQIEKDLIRYYDAEIVERASRPLDPERRSHLDDFVFQCRSRGLVRVLEVGCGAGRDGIAIAGAGLNYSGVDLTPNAVAHCQQLGLDAQEAHAASLPFGDDAFDAVWSMSTLMHLPGHGLDDALKEVRRVLAPGGLFEVGVWGSITAGDYTDAGGRYFRHRTGEELQERLSAVGSIEAFSTWSWWDDGGHYQWARVVAAAD